ncbi:hypothetical protein ABTX81_33680 [Kitasatospora sp. NPDC097605]|uniref:hypothetical protein n=1 Tax=Kitasatospora sp. NPDC097605 TaxID=3157226 RepID=UPI00332DF824
MGAAARAAGRPPPPGRGGAEWGVGTADKSITTGLCPGGRLRMERLLRVLERKRLDPTYMTTHEFRFDEMERAFEVADKKLEDVLKVLIAF